LAGDTEVLGENPPPVPLCPPQIPPDLDSNPGRRGGKPANNSLNSLSYGTAKLERYGYSKVLGRNTVSMAQATSSLALSNYRTRERERERVHSDACVFDSPREQTYIRPMLNERPDGM
jgi:hypothetical protein